MRPWYGPDGPSSVRGGDPSAPLPDPATIEGTPALAAIREGLGAYLLAQGYVAEHPLLYVDERDDPYVYVRFDISEDGLGFIDTTYVYSPGVSRQLDEIFEAYGAYGPDEPHEPHTSETWMLGRPVHADIQALKTFEAEDEIQTSEDRYDLRYAIKVARKRRTCPGKLWLRLRARRRGHKRRLRFRAKPEPTGLDRISPRFRALPLNWHAEAEYESDCWSSWLATPDPAPAARANVEVWRAYVEPRLIHASRDRGADIPLKTWLSGGGGEGGRGILGEEWQMHDRLYWSMKAPCETPYSWEDNKFCAHISDAEFNLYYEFENLEQRLALRAICWKNANENNNYCFELINETQLPRNIIHSADFALAAKLFRRQTAIAAFRFNVPPNPDWRTKLNHLLSSPIKHDPYSVIGQYISTVHKPPAEI